MSIEENRDLPKSAKKKKFTDSPKKTDERKKTAFEGAAIYKYMSKREWENTYPIPEVNGNKYTFYCILCKRKITYRHMGLRDVKQQYRTPHRKTMEK